MTKEANQINKELKWLKAQETNPSLLYVRELRGRNVNEESHTPPLFSLPQDQTMCIVQPKIQNPLIAFQSPYVKILQQQLTLFHLNQVQK